MTAKISLIIPVYNSAKTIEKCLASIFAQTFGDFEVIAVNDGSSDESADILSRWQDKIKIFSQVNNGAPSARNFGFKKSQGDYVIFCDSDVVMRPDMLQKMYEALAKNPEAAYAYSSFRFGWKKFKSLPYNLSKLQEMPYIHTTSLLRRKFFPGFDESLKRFQDWDLWLTIGEKGGQGVWLNEVLFYAKSGGTMSHWLPKLLYRLSWLKFVKSYNEAKEIIKKKHNL
ncbi:MAG: glycosyltransferase family A protein [Candidatus Buchananbacteria bacterium]|nr:glycosyltransferase family A protein [Candidatus Buchananbacteria bacterium]